MSSTERFTAANTYPTARIPSRLEVNKTTGGAVLYDDRGLLNAFGRVKMAVSDPSDPNKWTITEDFVQEYNNRNNTNLTQAEAQKLFTTKLAKQANYQRAEILKKNATKEDLERLSKTIPGVADPKTKIKKEDTAQTEATDTGGTGDDENPDSGEKDGSTRAIEPVDLDTSKKTGTRTKFGNLNYPETRDPGQDIIKFDMLEYNPKKLAGFAVADNREIAASQRTIGSVTLPIPGGISDANACNWGDNTMNPLQIAGAAIALNLLGEEDSTTTKAGLGGVLGNLKNTIVDNNETVQSAISGITAAAAIGSDINSLLSRTQGMILNPNLELLFQGPTLRPFSFQFKLSPRSANEAKEIVKIIRFFKQGMAPIREKSRLFLRTPNTFKIKYVQLGSDSESPFMNKFKECALLSCNVQYTPEGNYAPYEDGAMSSYVMSLQFKELEPVYNDDYGDKDIAAVGF